MRHLAAVRMHGGRYSIIDMRGQMKHLHRRTKKMAASSTPHGRRRRHDESWKGAIVMIIEAELEQLSESQRKMLKEDAKRWARIGAGAHLDDWLAFGPTLHLLRGIAMRAAHANTPQGRRYSFAFSELLESEGFKGMERNTISAVLWLHDDKARIDELNAIRSVMTPGQRSRLNSPISARKRIEASINAREITKAREANGNHADAPESEIKLSPMAKLKNELADLRREKANLEREYNALKKNDGSLFDLKRDKIADIVGIMTTAISPRRAEDIARGVLKRLNQAKPAG